MTNHPNRSQRQRLYQRAIEYMIKLDTDTTSICAGLVAEAWEKPVEDVIVELNQARRAALRPAFAI